MMLGRSGAGKSAAANYILGQKAFESHPESLTAITKECEKKKALVEGRQVSYEDVCCYHSQISPLHCVPFPKHLNI